MRWRTFTYEDFGIKNDDPTIEDAVLCDEDLAEIKRLAGVSESAATEMEGNTHSPVGSIGSNISLTGMEKKQLEREHNIQPGTPEWFRLWFSLPKLTGEKPVSDKEKKSTSPVPKNAKT